MPADQVPPLAVASYRAVQVEDTPGVLSLCWTSDERTVLEADVLAVARAAWNGDALERYLVTDPYGEAAVTDAVRTYLGLVSDRAVCTTGAGVGALLAAVARMSDGAAFWTPGIVYPDIVRWLHVRGGRVATCEKADLILVERPSVLGRQLSVEQVEQLLVRTRQRGALVVVDESNANYEHPHFSVARLLDTGQADRLIVLRGLSKAYGLGALRFGCALTTVATAARLRDAIPPLQVATPSLDAARRIYDLGDIGATLRRLVMARKPELTAELRRAGNVTSRPSPKHLPYVLTAAGAVRTRTGRLEIQGKVHHGWGTDGPVTCGRYSVPFEAPRWARVAGN